jgi:hypothetical protein
MTSDMGMMLMGWLMTVLIVTCYASTPCFEGTICIIHMMELQSKGIHQLELSCKGSDKVKAMWSSVDPL